MSRNFDLWGWYTTDSRFADRVADIEPEGKPGTPVPGKPYPNWTGFEWQMQTYVAPPAPVEPEPVPLPPEAWWITPGGFKDRFDSLGYPGLKLTILGLSRTNDTCYAVLADLTGRHYVDLKARRDELLVAFGMIADALAEANKPEFTQAMQEAILDTPLQGVELYTPQF